METQPRLSSENCIVFFFSRGRGHGHAIPDMAIADELAKLRSDIDIKFVSYGTGAKTFVAHGKTVINLGMPDMNPVWATVVRAGQLISQLRPALVVSHEEFAIPPAARLFDIPAVFITDWFPDPEDPRMEALSYADEVIVIESEGAIGDPPGLESKVRYSGPVLRSFSYGRADRDRARQELGFPSDATVILVLPGGWTEERTPISDLVMRAFDSLKGREKLLVWVAGDDYEELAGCFRGRADVIVKDHDWQMDRLMVASDIAVTKATRNTTAELAALGLPSISISSGLNPIDDVAIRQFETNTPLDARTATPKMLAAALLDALKENAHRAPGAEDGLPPKSDGAALAAQHLSRVIDRLCRQSTEAPLAAR